ncbi:MobF family relaxase [Flavilitoribacter nigricans]|uniref:AAA+ ATPase domain-containing protein n=1 Tax=Flavilitoribacter nigricans (strain ATCC 23147 / DSM 23189 / NBRC 102662 / NCIMB 1420 / SS-2) TaxID=1122177 RepID=A0A2D0N789_FLAN2|nr:MobF family relaxase [Flavilitoribacter nigricans]PHN04384.1 hypothetical protein CRP01_22765 [Flavilitoribacter nigricans DSM 23189 = NBRC 102662]
MLRITTSRSAAGALQYFNKGLTKSDYYAEKGEIIGKWQGRTAERLGLSGDVGKEQFEALAYNKDPATGEQLTVRNASSRRVGYDFTFSVPKSVSVVYGLTKDNEIYEAFNAAVQETMLEIEQNAATRVRSNGRNENRTTGNLVWGTFTHDDARPVGGIPDPHLHQHVFVFNVTYDDQEKRFKAAQFGDIKADGAYYEAVFNSRLADKLQKVGYQIERNERDFEFKGFGRSTIDKYSNRTREINQKAKELGLTFAEDKAELGAKTRANKRDGYDKEDIRLQWRSRLSEKELELVHTAKGEPPPGGGTAVEKKMGRAREAFDYALDHSLERKSVAGEKELLILGLKRGIGTITPEDLEKELASRKDLLSNKDRKSGEVIYTTPEALAEENRLRDSARAGKGTFQPIHSDYQVKNEMLTAEQTAAVKHVLSSKDFITVVTGDAGTGKTWSIKEVAEGMKEKAVTFGAFAPSSAASREVQRGDGFENATTIAELLQSKKLQESVKDGVIWVDEAGMVGNKTMNQVIKVAQEQNARILLTGDTKQHGSVERGDALRIIEEFGGIQPARISKIQRQKVDAYRKAVENISKDQVEKGYQLLDRMGAIKEAPDFEQAKVNVAGEYAASVKAKENVLIVATTHAQGKAVTETIREKLKTEGMLRGEEKRYAVQKNLSYTDAQKKDRANYSEGMIVQFHQNVKGGIKRGTKYQVLGKDQNGDVLVADEQKNRMVLPVKAANKFSVYRKEEIELAQGDQIRITQNGFSNEKKRLNNGNILSVVGFDQKGNIIASTGKNEVTVGKNFGNLSHGYYTTSPGSQGKSVNRVIIMQSTMTGRAASKEQFYVSASRGKFAISIHTDDKQQLLRSVQRSSQRMTAGQVASSGQQPERTGLDKLKVIGSIYRTAVSKVANLKDTWQNKTVGIISMIPKPPQPIKHAPVRSK